MSAIDCINQPRLQLDNCDHNNPTRQQVWPDIYQRLERVIFMVTPKMEPQSFLLVNDHGPESLTNGNPSFFEDLSIVSKQYCVDGKELYSFE